MQHKNSINHSDNKDAKESTAQSDEHQRLVTQRIDIKAEALKLNDDQKTIPNKLHFIWFGKFISNEKLNTIKLWKKTNPHHEVTLWIDRQILLINLIREKREKLSSTIPKIDIVSTPQSTSLTSQTTTFPSNTDCTSPTEMNQYDKKINDFINELKSDGITTLDIQNEKISDRNIRYEIDQVCPNYGAASDLARYKILYIHGGIYLDCDLKPKNPLPLNIRPKLGILFKESINNDIIYSSSSNPILRELIHFTQQAYTLSANSMSNIKSPGLFDDCTLTEAAKIPFDLIYNLDSHRSKFRLTLYKSGPRSLERFLICNALTFKLNFSVICKNNRELFTCDIAISDLANSREKLEKYYDLSSSGNLVEWMNAYFKRDYLKWVSTHELITHTVNSIRYEINNMGLLHLSYHIYNLRCIFRMTAKEALTLLHDHLVKEEELLKKVIAVEIFPYFGMPSMQPLYSKISHATKQPWHIHFKAIKYFNDKQVDLKLCRREISNIDKRDIDAIHADLKLDSKEIDDAIHKVIHACGGIKLICQNNAHDLALLSIQNKLPRYLLPKDWLTTYLETAPIEDIIQNLLKINVKEPMNSSRLAEYTRKKHSQILFHFPKAFQSLCVQNVTRIIGRHSKIDYVAEVLKQYQKIIDCQNIFGILFNTNIVDKAMWINYINYFICCFLSNNYLGNVQDIIYGHLDSHSHIKNAVKDRNPFFFVSEAAKNGHIDFFEMNSNVIRPSTFYIAAEHVQIDLLKFFIKKNGVLVAETAKSYMSVLLSVSKLNNIVLHTVSGDFQSCCGESLHILKSHRDTITIEFINYCKRLTKNKMIELAMEVIHAKNPLGELLSLPKTSLVNHVMSLFYSPYTYQGKIITDNIHKIITDLHLNTMDEKVTPKIDMLVT